MHQDQHVTVSALLEPDEIVGYHLERAVRYLRELGSDDSRVAQLSNRAGSRLSAAGLEGLGIAEIAQPGVVAGLAGIPAAAVTASTASRARGGPGAEPSTSVT